MTNFTVTSNTKSSQAITQLCKPILKCEEMRVKLPDLMSKYPNYILPVLPFLEETSLKVMRLTNKYNYHLCTDFVTVTIRSSPQEENIVVPEGFTHLLQNAHKVEIVKSSLFSDQLPDDLEELTLRYVTEYPHAFLRSSKSLKKLWIQCTNIDPIEKDFVLPDELEEFKLLVTRVDQCMYDVLPIVPSRDCKINTVKLKNVMQVEKFISMSTEVVELDACGLDISLCNFTRIESLHITDPCIGFKDIGASKELLNLPPNVKSLILEDIAGIPIGILLSKVYSYSALNIMQIGLVFQS